MRKRVLAVDDDERLRRLLRVNLESPDIEVTEVGTGEECLRIAEEGGIDLILLDLNLPDCTGWDVLAALRRVDRLKPIPVIVLSVVPPDETQVERWQPEQYLQKPFDARQLPGLVHRVLYGQRYDDSDRLDSRLRGNDGDDVDSSFRWKDGNDGEAPGNYEDDGGGTPESEEETL